MRRLPVLAVLFLVLFAGCLSAQSGTPTERTGPETSTFGTAGQAANNLDADHGVHVENRGDEPVTLTLRVVRETTGEVVHERTWSEPPGGEHEVYNLEQADPDGVERFRVTLELDDHAETVELETSGCYGDAFFTVTEQGALDATYAIC